MIKMVVMDLDKTLLKSDGSISKYTENTLKKYKENGVKLVFATARSEKSASDFIELLNPNAVIANGGSIINAEDEIIFHSCIDKDIARSVFDNLIKSESVEYITTDTDGGYYVNKLVDEDDPSWKDYLPVKYADFSKKYNCEIYKITVETSDINIVQEIKQSFPSIDYVGFAGENWFQFFNKDANKWNGIMRLASFYKFSLEEVVVFGDDYNDIEMIKNAGLGIAVKNAIPEVKAVADFICDSNDNNGIAKWLNANKDLFNLDRV